MVWGGVGVGGLAYGLVFKDLVADFYGGDLVVAVALT